MNSTAPALKTFHGRNRQHAAAMDIFRSVLSKHGFLVFESGIETEEQEHWQLLSQQYDTMSIMLRFRPDQTAVLPGISTLLFEIKSESLGYPNFAIEDLSYIAAREWHTPERKVAYTFVDLTNDTVKLCWFDEVPEPHTIFVPKRWDFKIQKERVCQMWPGAWIIEKEYRNGSGTPYFLIPKTLQCFRSSTSFFAGLTKPKQLTLL